MMRTFTRRVCRLEQILAPKRQHRIVVRYEGFASGKFPEPTPEEMEGNSVLTIRLVAAKDGRPVDPEDAAR